MMTRRNAFLVCLLVVAFTTSGAQASRASNAYLTFQSQSGDPIGEGSSYQIPYFQASHTIIAQILRTLPDGSPTELKFIVDLNGEPLFQTHAELIFGTDQLGIPIHPGTYTNAERAASADPGHPGLDFSFYGNFCPSLTGSFTITDVSFY